MRASERIAVAAVALMVAPAFLAFPALGVWGVMHVWPGLTAAQHLWFWLSLAMLGITLPYVSRRHLDAIWVGRTRRLSGFEEALIPGPLAVGVWSLTGNWVAASTLFYPKLLVAFLRICDALMGRAEPSRMRALARSEDVGFFPATRFAGWAAFRRPSSPGRPSITMGPRPAKSRRSRSRWSN